MLAISEIGTSIGINKIVFLFWLTLLVLGCRTTEVNVYHKVSNSRLDQVYVKPGVDFSKYHKVLLDPLGVGYVKTVSQAPYSRDVERMQNYFSKALKEALEDRYDIANEPGPDVLRLRAQIIDLKLTHPGSEVALPAKKYKFAMLLGQMTLVGELQDSISGETLVKGADLEKEDEFSDDSTSLSDWDAVEKAFRRWAKIFRLWMDEVHGHASI